MRTVTRADYGLMFLAAVPYARSTEIGAWTYPYCNARTRVSVGNVVLRTLSEAHYVDSMSPPHPSPYQGFLWQLTAQGASRAEALLQPYGVSSLTSEHPVPPPRTAAHVAHRAAANAALISLRHSLSPLDAVLAVIDRGYLPLADGGQVVPDLYARLSRRHWAVEIDRGTMSIDTRWREKCHRYAEALRDRAKTAPRLDILVTIDEHVGASRLQSLGDIMRRSVEGRARVRLATTHSAGIVMSLADSGASTKELEQGLVQHGQVFLDAGWKRAMTEESVWSWTNPEDGRMLLAAWPGDPLAFERLNKAYRVLATRTRAVACCALPWGQASTESTKYTQLGTTIDAGTPEWVFNSALGWTHRAMRLRRRRLRSNV